MTRLVQKQRDKKWVLTESEDGIFTLGDIVIILVSLCDYANMNPEIYSGRESIVSDKVRSALTIILSMEDAKPEGQ